VSVDTRVVPANVAYPIDSGLLVKAIRRIAPTGRRIQAWAARRGPSCGTGHAQRTSGAWPVGHLVASSYLDREEP